MPACRTPVHRPGAALAASPLTLAAFGALLGFAATLSFQALRPVSGPHLPSSSRQCAPAPTSSARLVPDDASQLERHGLAGESGLLLVGIMTAAKYVDTRAYAVWKTWAPLIPGKVIFFVAEGTTSVHPELPIVRLSGTDDAYPPQKKSFTMLKWMAREGLGRFQWFLRADDDVYVRGDRLELLLRSLNSSRPYLIGQAGLGTAEEYGTLSLGSDDNYCMGGPGILFSAATLATVAPHLPHCLRNLYTTHEDVEVGRCVRKFVGISCSWSYEMQNIFYNNQSGQAAFSSDLNVDEVHSAITLHPVKKPSVMHRLHAHLRQLKTRDLRYRWIQLSRDVAEAGERGRKAGSPKAAEWEEEVREAGRTPSLRRFAPANPDDALVWDFLSPNIRFCADEVNCPRHNVPSYLRYALGDVRRQLLHLLNRNQRQAGRVLTYTDTLYAYHRLDPIHGPEFVLDLLLLYKKFKGRRLTVPVRRHAYVTQTFGELVIASESAWRSAISPPHSAPTQDAGPLTIVVPLSGRLVAFTRFLDNFQSVCLQSSEDSTNLLVVLYSSGSEEDRLILARLQALREAHGERVSWLEKEGAEFSRGRALALGAAALPPSSLLFFTDADVLFTPAALRRIRANTLPGRSAYFPIVFSEFAPETWEPLSGPAEIPPGEPWPLDARRGYFRHFGFGLVAIHGRDLEAVGGMDTDIQGWGLEDVQLFERVLKASWLTPFRAPDPGLLHVYHPVVCSANLSPGQYEMCLGSRVTSFASAEALSAALREERELSHLFPRTRS